jgi:hypothetical protein
MTQARWVDCPGMADPFEHTMRDHCWNCAPFWERIPVCPDCNRKLQKRGRTKCKHCKAWTFVGADERKER